MGQGKFLYAIIEGAGEACLSFTGLDDLPLETVPYRDLAAVVSPIDLGRFDETDEAHFEADLVRYQQVNAALLQRYTMVPMRFGFTARDEEHVQEVLGKVYLQLRTLLNRLRGKVELVVHAFWDLPKVLRDIADHEGCPPSTPSSPSRGIGANLRPPLPLGEGWGEGSPDLEPACSPPHPDPLPEGEGIEGSALHRLSYLNLAPMPSREGQGGGDRERVLEVGRRLFEAAEVRRQGFIEAIHAQLSPLAGGFADGPRQGEAMILNRSYLVEKAKEPLFDEAMNRLGETFDGDLTFRYVGPLPAYSFANVVFTQGNFALVDRARKTLQLPESSSLDQCKAAYRRLIRTYHPDRNPGDPLAEERCKEVVVAYEILNLYCQSYQNACAEGTVAEYSFAREEVEQVFIEKFNVQRATFNVER